MSGNTEWKVSESGQVIQAAPDIPARHLGPKPLPGSKPRNWETRKSNECAAIVKTTRKFGEWPVHFSCCLPVDPNIQGQWCKGHNPHLPTGSVKDLARSLRKHL